MQVFKKIVLRIYRLEEKQGRDLISDMYVQNKKYKNNVINRIFVTLDTLSQQLTF